MAHRTCSIDGCERPYAGRRGWCELHYGRWRRNGDPLVTTRVAADDDDARLTRYVEKTDSCWLWLGSTDHNGYGQFRRNGRMVYAHRWSYERNVGPIAAGLQVDHLCRTPRCVRPEHLEAVTQRENILRGAGNSARAVRDSTCKRGHGFTPDNTYLRPNGARNCRACRAIRDGTTSSN